MMSEDEIAAIEAKYEEWSPDWRALLPEEVALLAEVKASRDRERKLQDQHEDDVSRLMRAGHENGQLRAGIKAAAYEMDLLRDRVAVLEAAIRSYLVAVDRGADASDLEQLEDALDQEEDR